VILLTDERGNDSGRLDQSWSNSHHPLWNKPPIAFDVFLFPGGIMSLMIALAESPVISVFNKFPE
jgi:hypothetical protein